MIALTSVSDDRSMRKGGLYQATQKKIAEIFTVNKWFNKQAHWSIKDVFNTSFYQENKAMLDEPDAAKNGRLYKPYVINEELKKLDYGDFLIYTDCSPEMWTIEPEKLSEVYSLDIIKSLCVENNDFLVGFVKWDDIFIGPGQLGKHLHHWFTSDSCLEIMECEEYRYSFQCASGMICIRKTEITEQLVGKWLHYNSIPECAAMNVSEHENFYHDGKPGYKLGNRSDQGVLSLLLNARNYNYCDIVYNDLNPYNFLNFCRKDVNYKFINSNIKEDERRN